ncbi:hypothetical protein AB0M39_01810 [Streptomyces sp. NPDC051907]|uniref:hypothetical protein n=1 Tax=Streptomyces sp. NPDC051907 TaxID=3155284 RepID=UPI003418F16D
MITGYGCSHSADGGHPDVASGWSVSRGTAAPTPTGWGFTVDVGLSVHVVRHVLTTADEAVIREITEDTTAPGV